MPMYDAKQSQVRERQLKIQELRIPFSIASGAASSTNDEPAVLFVKTASVNQISSSTGALDSGETAPTFVAQDNANGLFSVLVKVGEPIKKVAYAMIVRRSAHGLDTCKLANTTGVSENGDKIVLDCDTGVDLSAAALDACLLVGYEVQE